MSPAGVSPGRVLLVYATTHGHTAKIAGHLADAVRSEGMEVDLRPVAEAREASPASYQGAIVAASVHGGGHQHEMVDWVRHHHLALGDRPSAFFSVSLTAAEDTDEAREATREIIDDFLDDTGWTPTESIPIAGALQYREYDPFTRMLMRLTMRRGGHSTDVSHDHDYTDWETVRRLGREFAERVTARGAPVSGV